MSIARTIAKNSLFNFIATTADAVAVFIVGIVLPRSLGTEQYGTYSFMMWFLSLAALVVNLGMGDMSRRFIAEAIGLRSEKTTKGFVQLNFIVRGSATLVVFLLILFFTNQLTHIFNVPGDGRYFTIISFVLLSYIPVMTLQGIFAGFQKYEYSAYLTLIVSPLRALLIILLVVYHFGVSGVLLAYLGVWAIGAGIGFFLLRRLVPLHDLFQPSLLEPQARSRALKYSMAATGLLGVDYVLWQQAEVLFLGMFRTVEEVGFYNIAHRIPMMAINLAPYVVGQVLLPAVAEQFGKGDMQKIKNIYSTSARYLMMLSLPLAAGGIALARPIITVLFGAEYAPAIILMQIVFIPFALRGFNQAVSSVIYGINQPTFLLKIGVVLAAMSVGLNFWLIPKYGALGAVIATAIPRVLSLPIYIRFVSRKIGEPWPMRDTIKIVLASLIMGGVIYAVQAQVGVVTGLAAGIILGLVVYITALFFLRIIGERDLEILEKVQEMLPRRLKKPYGYLLKLSRNIMSITRPGK
jgi:O-antigen/teichoic acid export membrane protein